MKYHEHLLEISFALPVLRTAYEWPETKGVNDEVWDEEGRRCICLKDFHHPLQAWEEEKGRFECVVDSQIVAGWVMRGAPAGSDAAKVVDVGKLLRGLNERTRTLYGLWTNKWWPRANILNPARWTPARGTKQPTSSHQWPLHVRSHPSGWRQG